MKDAKWVCQRFEEMRSDRATHETTWRRISDVLRPLRANMQRTVTTPGERRHQRIYDSSPLVALSNFKAGLFGTVTNPAAKWFEAGIAGFEPEDYSRAAKDWKREVTRRIALTFTPSMSGFYNQAPGLYADLGAFGNSIFYSQEIIGQQRYYDETLSLEHCYFALNQWGEVDELARLLPLTAKQAVEKFGEDTLSQTVRDAAKDRPSQRFEFIHYTGPNPSYRPDRLGPDGMPIISIYVEREKQSTIKTENYRMFPFQCPRWDVAAGEEYGRGQGEVSLNDILSLQAARRTNLTMGERAANPTLLAPDELAMSQGVRAIPGSVIYGGMSVDGRARVGLLGEGKNIAISLEMENQIRDSVKDAFLFSLMQIQGSADMTATEFLGRQQERWRLLGPHLGRIESEFLTPLIRRRFLMLLEAGQIPDPPEEIAGLPLEVTYVSQAAKLQRMSEAESAINTASALSSIAELRPEVMDKLDVDAFADAVGHGYGSNIILTNDEAGALREARNQQQQQAALMEAAPQMARGIRDIAQAGAVADAA